jgi:hypothetical protein
MKNFHVISFNKFSLVNVTEYVLKLITAVLVLTASSLAVADLPFCSDIFQNGIQAHGVDNFIRFNYNAQLVNGSSSQLNTRIIQTNKWSTKKSCGLDVCTATGTSVDGLVTNELLTSSANEIIIPSNKRVTIGANNQREYGKIVLSDRSVATFVPQTQPYVITTLEVGYKSKLRLPAGEYHVLRLILEAEGKIDVIGEGQVTLYVSDSMWVPYNFRINGNTKNPAKMAIYTFSDSNYYSGSKTYAFVRTEGEVILDYRSTIVGGVLGKFINLETDSQVVYDPAAAKEIKFDNLCRTLSSYVDEEAPVVTFNAYDETTDQSHVTITGTIIDSGINASGVIDVTALIDGAYVPISLVGNNFTLSLQLQMGVNYFTVITHDLAGNEAFIPFYIIRVPTSEL